jgi:hypothetical protein
LLKRTRALLVVRGKTRLISQQIPGATLSAFDCCRNPPGAQFATGLTRLLIEGRVTSTRRNSMCRRKPASGAQGIRAASALVYSRSNTRMLGLL